MKIKVQLDSGAYMPTREHAADAGYDLYAREDAFIWEGRPWVFDTGVHVEIPEGYIGLLKSESGLNINPSIRGEGVIDSGYTGSIRVKLYSDGEPFFIHRGEKISQLVILPIITPELEQVDHLEDTERGINGFGSSGK